MVGCLCRAALVVQCGTAGSVVLAQGQPGVTGNVPGLFSSLRDTAAGQVINVGLVQPAALDDFLQGLGQQLCGMKSVQISHAGFSSGYGGPDCFYDNCFTHG